MKTVVFVTSGGQRRIDAGWLERTRRLIPGRWYARPGLAAGVEALDAGDESPAAIVAALKDHETRDHETREHDGGLLILRAGIELPADFASRITRALESPDCPDVLVPAGNHAQAIDPLAGLEIPADADIDSLIAACGTGQFFPLNDAPPGCVIVNNTALRCAGLLDTLYVHDPAADHQGYDPRVSLGHLRLGVQRLLEEGVSELARDGRPVTLHISHNWGGGITRWITDFIGADPGGHHLVLAACSDFEHQRYGQRLRLFATGPDRGCIREWSLSPVITDTAPAHNQYRQVLERIIGRHSVGRIMVSSLIGHSLDALRTGLPTLAVLHDYYPAWPLLEHDPLGFADDTGRIDLENALQTHGQNMRFAAGHADYWCELTRHWLAAIKDHGIRLVAPGENVAQRWRSLLGPDAPDIALIGHGFPGWPEETPEIIPEDRADGRLRLVIVGRMQEGKGLGLLKAALPELRRHAHLTLIGSGHGGKALFGLSGINIVYQYEQAQLPALLAEIKPHAALFLSTVAETWNYTLSELRSLGLVPIATRLGSFAERIRDGIDGILIKPEPEALIDAVTQLKAEPQQLTTLRKALPAEHGLTEMVTAYDALLPVETHPPTPPAAAGEATLEQAALAGRLAEREQSTRRLSREHEALVADLEERTRWAETMERQFRERTRWAEQLEASRKEMAADLEERTRWAEQLDQRIKVLDTRILEGERKRQSLENRLSSAMGQIGALETERDRIFASRSWRLTRPLRVAARLARNIRRKQWWKPSRWPRRLGSLWHHLRLRGFKNTLWLLQQEDATSHVPAPSLLLPEVSVPNADAPLSPVAVPSSDQPKVSIIIPVYNQVHFTHACLQSIARSAATLPFEAIVVDDKSTDGTGDFLASCQGVRVITQLENRGFIHSCNNGANHARGEVLVFLNNDTTVSDGWLDALIQTFEDFPDTGIAGARLVFPDGTLQEAGGIIFNNAHGWNYGRGQAPDLPEYNFACETDYVSGACLAIPKALFDQLQGFDAYYAPAYYEDTDLCFRVREAGHRVICQTACTIVHHEGATSGTDESTGTKRYQAVNRKKFRQRWRDALTRQPAQVPGNWAIDELWHARHHTCRGRMLIVDAVTPQPDHDSGSVRMRALIEICQKASIRVTFAPENLAFSGDYTRIMQRQGTEVLYGPHVTSLEAWLESHHPELDWVILSRHYVATNLLPLIKRLAPNAKVIFDTVDLHFLREEREAEITQSAVARKRAAASRKQELKLIAECDYTLVVSPVEKKLLTELNPNADVHVLSNIHQIEEHRPAWSERKDFMFVGGFQHQPNVDAVLWLAQKIFPLIHAELPDVRLHVIGSRMPPDIAGMQVPGIVVHGFVPDLEPYLNGCRLSLAPLRYGAGVKGKVNQAMAHGLPVIATDCAAEGMFLEHGKDVLIADDAEAYAREVVRAYNNEELWQQLSDGGLANVEKYFSRHAARETLQGILDGR